MWLIAAALSALFAGITSILAKCGIRKTDSDVATALKTIVVLIFSWIMVFVVGSAGTISQIQPASYLFLILSGAATGASWMCYFKALSIGDVNKVVPIDKSSTVLTVLLAIILFHETDHLAVKLTGTVLLGAGVILMVEKKKNRADRQRECLYTLCHRLRRVCRAHLYPCQNRDFRSGVQSGNRDPHDRSADHGLGNGSG